MCSKCLSTETLEEHKARHPGVPTHSNDPDFKGPLQSFKGHKMLCEINVGEIVYVVGRLLQPFCSHALYRVSVTHLHNIGNGCFVIQGALVDFKDAPVKTYAIDGKQLVRWEPVDEQGNLSAADIERIVKAQGFSVRFSEYSTVEVRLSLGRYTTSRGKIAQRIAKKSLGYLASLGQMSEEDLIALLQTMFARELRQKAEKVEV